MLTIAGGMIAVAGGIIIAVLVLRFWPVVLVGAAVIAGIAVLCSVGAPVIFNPVVGMVIAVLGGVVGLISLCYRDPEPAEPAIPPPPTTNLGIGRIWQWDGTKWIVGSALPSAAEPDEREKYRRDESPFIRRD